MAACVLQVHVMIGVGKTTLLRNAIERHGVLALREDVNDKMLQEYIAGDMSAFDFQRVMLLASTARSSHAIRAASLLQQQGQVEAGLAGWGLLRECLREGCLIVNERAASENRVFALANHATGKMTRAELDRYEEYVQNWHGGVGESGETPAAPAFDVRLWAPVAVCQRNMLLRGNPDEAKYDTDKYMHALHHYYFAATLYGLLRGLAVVDWTHYGDYAQLRDALLAEPGPVAAREATPDTPLPPSTLLEQVLAHCCRAAFDGDSPPELERLLMACASFTPAHARADALDEGATPACLHFDYKSYAQLDIQERMLIGEALLSCLAVRVNAPSDEDVGTVERAGRVRATEVVLYEMPPHSHFLQANWSNPVLARDGCYGPA
jgi:deoxyadenosine/deoxycytidine kinase